MCELRVCCVGARPTPRHTPGELQGDFRARHRRHGAKVLERALCIGAPVLGQLLAAEGAKGVDAVAETRIGQRVAAHRRVVRVDTERTQPRERRLMHVERLARWGMHAARTKGASAHHHVTHRSTHECKGRTGWQQPRPYRFVPNTPGVPRGATPCRAGMLEFIATASLGVLPAPSPAVIDSSRIGSWLSLRCRCRSAAAAANTPGSADARACGSFIESVVMDTFEALRVGRVCTAPDVRGA